MPARKVIITCAVTGSAHTPTMSPNLPYTVEDVVGQSVAAVEAGAAIIHLHARDPKDGSPTADPAVFLDYLKGIKDSTDAVVSITSGGGTGMSVEDRLRVIYETRPELCTLNLGTFNYGSFPMIPKYAGTWKFDWEEPYLESTRVEPFVSTFADIEHMLTDVRRQTGSRFEYEAYDVGHLYTLAYYLEAGLVEPPIFLQTIMGVMGGIGATVEHLAHMRSTADRLLGDAYEWSVLGAGRHQFEMITASAVMGSHVRVGLEDGLFIGAWRAGGVQRPAGREDPADPLRALDRDRDAGRGARDPRPQGSRPGRLVSTVGRPAAGRGHDGHRHRHRSHRWRLGRALPPPWVRRRRVGPRPRRRDPLVDAARHRLAVPGAPRAQPPGPTGIACAGRTRSRRRSPTRTSSRSRRPEVLDAKVRLLAAIDKATHPEVVVASSTSGPADDRHGGRVRQPRTLRGRAPVQPAVPDPAGRGGRRPRDRPGSSRPGPRRSTRRPARSA